MKRSLLTFAAGAAVLSLVPLSLAKPGDDKGGPQQFTLVETTIAQIHRAFQTQVISVEQLTQMYLLRIAAYDDAGPRINSYLYVNPNAWQQARQLDQIRGQGPRSRYPLFGVGVLLKDNIDTKDMPTTAGSVALAGSIPPDDAFITQRLRDAGAVILGKGTLTEFANFLALGMPTGYSSLGDFGFNPYDPRPDPRTTPPFNDGRPVLQTGGSSSGPGTGVTANLTTVAIGTETSGSLLSPASANGVVAIKPTVGLVSRDGIIPITADQDTAGPVARTVTDAAITLGVIAGYDPRDPATAACLTAGNCFNDYTQFLESNALNGARLAVFTPANPLPANRQALLDQAIADMRAQGATVRVLAATDIPPQLNACVSYPLPAFGTCSSVLLYGFQRDLNIYLSMTPNAPNHTLAQIVAFNAAYMPPLKYGQAIAIAASMVNVAAGSADTLRFQQDRALDLSLSRDPLNVIFNGPDGMKGTADDTDAILSVGNFFAAAPAKAGFPGVTVPGGFITAGPGDPPIANPFPQTITFTGPAFSEPRLIALGYAYEQATHRRVPPASTPALPSDTVVKNGRRK
ncbi:MAG: amidase family protein [Verrucomicrobiota bacterium]|nr:amidase family protein [Verrucomicrobiota bacterium]